VGALGAAGKDTEVVFVNLGNRPAVIRSVGLLYVEPAAKPEPRCSPQHGVHFATGFEATVLKPNDDAIVRKLRITQSFTPFAENIEATRRADGAFSFPLSRDNLSKPDVLMNICLMVHGKRCFQAAAFSAAGT
jgi:hypothetical protein